MKKRQSAGDAGPLLLYAEGFGDHLESKGYAPESVRWRLRQLAALDRWLLEHRLAAGDLDAGCVERVGRGPTSPGTNNVRVSREFFGSSRVFARNRRSAC